MDRFDEMRARKIQNGQGSGEKIYNVVFDSDGGSFVPTQKIVDGYQAKKPDDPVKEEGKFEVWLLNGEEFDFSTPITKDITLTAKWLAQLVNYKYLYNGLLNNTENWPVEVGGFLLDDYYDGKYNKSLTTNKDNIYIKGTSGDFERYSMLFTKNIINLANYKRFDVFLKLAKYSDHDPISTYVGVKSINDYATGTVVSRETSNTKVELYNASKNNPTYHRLSCDLNNVESGYPFVTALGDQTSIYVYNMFLLKQDNFAELCEIAGLNSTDYLDEVTLCANTNAINTILNNELAVNYMLFYCTGTFMFAFTSNSACIEFVNNSPYYEKIYGNVHWKKFLDMASEYGGAEWTNDTY